MKRYWIISIGIGLCFFFITGLLTIMDDDPWGLFNTVWDILDIAIPIVVGAWGIVTLCYWGIFAMTSVFDHRNKK